MRIMLSTGSPKEKLIVLLLGLLFAGSPASATVIFDNGGPETRSGSTLGSVSDFAGDLSLNQRTDDFVLRAGNNGISDIHWFGFYLGSTSSTDDFSIRIFADTGSGPDAASFGRVVFDSPINRQLFTTVDDVPIFSYSVSIDPIILAPDTTHWLSIVNNTGGSVESGRILWAWATVQNSQGSGNAHSRFGDGDNWSLEPFEYSFRLIAIPEPSTLVLLALGLAVLVTRRETHPLRREYSRR